MTPTLVRCVRCDCELIHERDGGPWKGGPTCPYCKGNRNVVPRTGRGTR